METSPNTQAILLLTTHFVKTRHGAEKPLTPKEWGRFAGWLKSRALTPENLLKEDLNGLLQDWQDKTVSGDRIKSLLDRGVALSLSMEKWSRSGLWVMTRSDSDYPARLKKRLGIDSPALFFGCGRRALLEAGGVAVVGSRKSCESDLEYSRELGKLVSQSGRSIVSGGARGVDESAMLGALEDEGTAVGVMADNLLRACTSAKYRRHLASNNLALISPFNPEAGFNAGNAMQRNKYIYCLAESALVVHSGKKGGTWNGATENLNKKWVPLLVKRSDDREAGNSDLIRKGATEAPAEINDIVVERLLESCINTYRTDKNLPGYTATSAGERTRNDGPNAGIDGEKAKIENTLASGKKVAAARLEEHTANDVPQQSFYRIFLSRIQPRCSSEPQTPESLADYFDISKSHDINKTQLNAWLNRAVSEGQMKKLTKPVRYQWIGQETIFK